MDARRDIANGRIDRTRRGKRHEQNLSGFDRRKRSFRQLRDRNKHGREKNEEEEERRKRWRLFDEQNIGVGRESFATVPGPRVINPRRGAAGRMKFLAIWRMPTVRHVAPELTPRSLARRRTLSSLSLRLPLPFSL